MDIFIYKVPGVRQQLHPADGYLSFFPHPPFITSSHRCLLHSPAQRSSSPPPALLPSPWGSWVCTHEQWETRKTVERDRKKKKWIPSLASWTAAAANRKWLFVSPPSSQRLVTCSCHPHISSKTHTATGLQSEDGTDSWNLFQLSPLVLWWSSKYLRGHCLHTAWKQPFRGFHKAKNSA